MSLNKLKQKVKKYLSTTGPADNNYEKQLATFREKPIWSEDEARAAKEAAKLQKAASTPSTQIKQKAAASSSESDSGSSDSSDEKTKKPKVAAKKKEESDSGSESSSESSSDSSSSSESSSKSSSEEEDDVNIFNMPREELTPA